MAELLPLHIFEVIPAGCADRSRSLCASSTNKNKRNSDAGRARHANPPWASPAPGRFSRWRKARSFTAAAPAPGRRSGDGVAKRVSRFNVLGLAALAARPLPGRLPTGEEQARERLLAEGCRDSNPAQEGRTAWSLSPLAAGATPRARWTAQGEHVHDAHRVGPGGSALWAHPLVVSHRHGPAPTPGRHRGRG